MTGTKNGILDQTSDLGKCCKQMTQSSEMLDALTSEQQSYCSLNY
jgi:hypothetical protein